MAIVYPRPPPTCNNLTPAQRTQLLRSNAKLGQVLGSTPHVLDEINNLAYSYSLDHCRSGRSSVDSLDSSYASTSTRSSIDSSPSRSRSPSKQSAQTPPSERVWRIRFPTKRPPMLRIGKTMPRPVDPRPNSPTGIRAQPQPLGEASRSPPSAAYWENESPPPTPSFNITSETAMRRQKMRRLAKKLGEGVPVHLVFPPTIESDEEEVLVDSPISSSSSSSSEWSSSCSSRDAEERELLWEKHTARRSRFVEPPKTSVVTSGRYVVHYHDTSGMHGFAAEGFVGLGCTTIPEE